jgi:dTMP kinase
MFITFEGLNSCGKSTQLALLAAHLTNQGLEGIVTAEPSSLGRELRAATIDREDITPMTRLLLFQADRAQHVTTVIRPALESGKIVLCDRYTDSTLAYQHWGDGLDVAQVSALNWMTTGGLVPNLTFFIDTSVKTCLERSADRPDQSPRHKKDLSYYERVRYGFLALGRNHPERFVSINGNYSIDATFDRIIPHVEKLIRELQLTNTLRR